MVNYPSVSIERLIQRDNRFVATCDIELVKESGTRNRKFIEIVTGHEFF